MTNDRAFDPEDVLRMARNMRGKLPRSLGLVILVAAAVIALVSSYYQVEPDEVAIVTRFGRFVNGILGAALRELRDNQPA